MLTCQYRFELGYFDEDTCRVEPIDNPFKTKVLPMCPERTLKVLVGREGFEPTPPNS